MTTTLEKQVLRTGPFAELIADGVRVGDTVYLSGAVAIDEQGEVVAPGDLLGQITKCYDNIRSVLAAYDADLSNIVDETWYVTDVAAAMGDLEHVFRTRAEAFGEQPALTQTCVEVSSLVMPDLMIEIKAIARL